MALIWQTRRWPPTPSIGLRVPCNVVVCKTDDGCVRVEFMDSAAVLALAAAVRERLVRVRDSL